MTSSVHMIPVGDLAQISDEECQIVIFSIEKLTRGEALSDEERERVLKAAGRLRATSIFARRSLFAMSPDFLQSKAWKRIRMDALERDNGKCQCCGRTAHDGAILNVDHIVPRAHQPELAMDLENLQVLCADCNEGKGNRYATDWRREA